MPASRVIIRESERCDGEYRAVARQRPDVTTGGGMRRELAALMAVMAAPWLALGPLDAQSGPAGQWRAVGGDAGYTRYSPLDQINRNNVRALKVAWQQTLSNVRPRTAQVGMRFEF